MKIFGIEISTETVLKTLIPSIVELSTLVIDYFTSASKENRENNSVSYQAFASMIAMSPMAIIALDQVITALQVYK